MAPKTYSNEQLVRGVRDRLQQDPNSTYAFTLDGDKKLRDAKRDADRHDRDEVFTSSGFHDDESSNSSEQISFFDRCRQMFDASQRQSYGRRGSLARHSIESSGGDAAYFSAKSSFSSSRTRSVETSGDFSSSLDDSWRFEDEYVKVANFTDEQVDGKVGTFGTLNEFREYEAQQRLANQIRDVVDNYSPRRIRISDYLTLRTACNIMQLARQEPYGLKGCKLIVRREDGDEKCVLGSLYPEPDGLISTFEVTLVLHLKKACGVRLPWPVRPVVADVAEQYELRKEKLYKSRRGSPTFSVESRLT